jgi:hypothetical protein
MRFEGTLTTWNDDRGFGFVTPLQGGNHAAPHAAPGRVAGCADRTASAPAQFLQNEFRAVFWATVVLNTGALVVLGSPLRGLLAR